MRVQTIDPKGANDADGNLYRPDKVLDIAVEDIRHIRIKPGLHSGFVRVSRRAVRHQPCPVFRDRRLRCFANRAQRREVIVARQHPILKRFQFEFVPHGLHHFADVIWNCHQLSPSF